MSFGDLLTREQSTHLLAGATAGLCVEVGVYPLDTMKTRLQSAAGTVRASCGRLHLFAGLPAVLVCSAPSGAAFFYAYEMCKQGSLHAGAPMWLSSMAGAGAGEITSLILRVPFENVKQRTQSRPHHTVRYVFSEIIQAEGWRGLYRGFLSTMFRELPSSLIQFPVWEFIKKLFAAHNRSKQQRLSGKSDPSIKAHPEDLTKAQFTFCGFVAGAVAGAFTTPVDVAKTRIMLTEMAIQGGQFWIIFGLSQALAITIFVLTIYWRGNFFNGFDYNNTPNLINYHAVFMVIGFVILFGESILCFRVLTFLPKFPAKIIHGVIHAFNFCLSVAGLAAIFEFYRRVKRPGMYSLHSWIGIFAVALYTFQWVLSLLVFFIPAVPDGIRAAVKRIHVPLGIIMFFSGVANCLMGITRVNFLDAGYPALVKPTAYGNALGVLLVAYCGFVVYLVIRQSFSRAEIVEVEY